MRLIGTIETQKDAERFSAYLNSLGIKHELDLILNNNWGSPEYGTPMCQLWIIDEDKVQNAEKALQEFHQNPKDPMFNQPHAEPSELHVLQTLPLDKEKKIGDEQQVLAPEPLTPLTFYILLLCSWIFIWGAMTVPFTGKAPTYLPPTPFYTPSVNKTLMYDYPNAYLLIDKLTALYTPERLQDPSDLPPQGQALIAQFAATPYWTGFYSYLLHVVNPSLPLPKPAPVFERIREGEIWRFFTPALLHSDIFHILFNMIWLVVLGKQMENRMRSIRYLVFILLAGIFSNTAQYLMSGSNFIGFSGILCAMLTFIWTRNQIAPWEGYRLDRSTMALLMIFIFAMFAIQVSSFFLETFFDFALAPGVANTAHLSGAFIGFILGRFNYFSWRQA